MQLAELQKLAADKRGYTQINLHDFFPNNSYRRSLARIGGK